MNIRRSIKRLLLVICSIILFSSFSQTKASDLSGSIAPLNPDFVNALKNKNNYKGIIPPPATIKSSSSQGIKGLSKTIDLPARYDLRDEGRVTSVKYQGTSNLCWAFASIASIESNIMPYENEDFSERNMAVYANNMFDRGYQNGGNVDMANAYLASWAGPVYEQEDPFIPPIDAAGTLNMQGKNISNQAKHVQEILYIPDRSNSLDNDKIKEAIKNYGAISSTMYYDDKYYDSNNETYFCNVDNIINHTVDIVGWDDDFPASKFNSKPEGNGAFIVKNSWGREFGDNGYFYVSYYDKAIGELNDAVSEVEPSNNYDDIYQYDPLGFVQMFGTGKTDTEWGANVFTSMHDNEKLAAASFYTLTEGSNYEIYVNENYDDNDGFANLKLVKKGVIDFAGYHTIKFDNPINLTNGNKFAVAVKITSPGLYFPIAIENPVSDYSTKAEAKTGQSFVSADGIKWDDICNSCPNTNVCIKAFTTIPHLNSEKRITQFKAKSYDNPGVILKDIIGDINETLGSIDFQIPYGVDENLLTLSVDTSMPVAKVDFLDNCVDVVANDGSIRNYDFYLKKYMPYYYKVKAGDYTLNILAPQSTGNDNIYMLGTFNNWGLKPGDPIGTINPDLITNYKLTKQPDGTYTINGSISADDQYKFVRGTSWDKVEDTVDAVNTINRTVGNEKNQFLLISKWVDKPDDLTISDGTMYCNSEFAPNSVIINNKAYNIRCLFNKDNTAEIKNNLECGNNIYYCLPAEDSSVNKWINLLNNDVLNTLDKENLNVLDYKDNNGTDMFFK